MLTALLWTAGIAIGLAVIGYLPVMAIGLLGQIPRLVRAVVPLMVGLLVILVLCWWYGMLP